jgi:TetR/AcrR family transcriptional regulator, regulator of cefoperazone and chloramphenicol sensitivity
MRKAKATNRKTARGFGLPIAGDRTKSRLLEAAGEMFAEVGFHHATIREICSRAGANVASINYHFRNKTGLYTEVVRQSMRAARLDVVRVALERDASPEEIFRGVVKARLESLWGQDQEDWHFRIMMHEIAKPTPAMNQVVTEAIRPVYDRLREVIGKIMGLPAEHQTTRLCAHSIIGQIMFYAFARPVIPRLWPDMKMTAAQLDRIADHIANFSLAYIRTPGAGQKKGNAPSGVRKRR